MVFLQEHGRVSDAARRDLYLAADLLLFPSLREGFGIPILEAGIARLPVFCSDIPPFRESAGEAAHYFGLDEDPAAIAGRIAAFLERTILRPGCGSGRSPGTRGRASGFADRAADRGRPAAPSL